MSTGIAFSEELAKHDPGSGHPESPERVGAIARALASPSLAPKLTSLPVRPAEEGQILLVHWERYYDEVMRTKGKDRTYLDADTVASPSSADVARLAAGAVVSAVESVMEGTYDNAFAFSRPPGHHAKPDKAMGFCFFNNVAVGAKFAQQRYGLDRVLVLDVDVHHGNGTQKAFYTSPEVLFVSMHQSPHYPGTGDLSELGKDEGEGFTVNLPMPAGMGNAEYLRLFSEIVEPVAREFSPELLLVSAGFDAHRDDPLGGMELTHEGFGALAEEILRLGKETCDGRTVFVLEGGYDLVALERSIVSVLSVMCGDAASAITGEANVAEILEEARTAHGAYWKSLRR